jgi:exodeoxyribonuclease V alpha subunit
MAETIKGFIDRILFHNPDNGFAVLRVQLPGKRDQATVVGHVAQANAGEYVEATGAWAQDRDHGLQFKADELHTAPPHTAEGIEKYLGSGLIKGIGPRFAKKIVAVFGQRSLIVIDESPAFLQQVPGIGPRRLRSIRESWQTQKSVQKILVFLQSHGIGSARAARIYKTYGDKAVETITANPYCLETDIWGIGFQTADQLAMRLGIDKSSPVRARAAVRFVLKNLSGKGHCGFPEEQVIERTCELTQIDRAAAAAAVATAVTEKEVVRETVADGTWLFLKELHAAEIGVARALGRLRSGAHPLAATDVEAAIAWTERKIGIQLATTQRQAVREATRNKVLVITGGPGVGKTTIIRAIVEIFSAKGLAVSLCAPTGRAAKRLGEATQQEAKTIHRLLEYDPGRGGFKRDDRTPIDCDLLVVDEGSMVDVVLMNQLLRAVKAAACLLLVGDVDQLPSVGPGAVLSDIIESRAVCVVRLTEIFRQAGQSLIVRAAHQVNAGLMPESSAGDQGDFYTIEARDPATVMERIISLVRDRIPARFGLDSIQDIQVLTPMNRTELGTRNLNARMQEILNPPRQGSGEARFGWTFRQGDKVLQTVNDYDKEVFNGDLGRIVSIDDINQEIKVDFDGRRVKYDYSDLDELTLAYAITIHKSQGSEYPAVVIPLCTQHFVMLQRNLLYTAITRGKKLVVLVGNRRALQLAVGRQDTNKRYTALASRLTTVTG